MSRLIKILGRIPGGLLLIPMMISALINTFAPEWKDVGEPFTSLLSGKGVMPLMAINLFASGTQLDKKSLPAILKKSAFLIAGRAVICIGGSFLFVHFFGTAGLLGVSLVAFAAAIASTNPGIFLSLCYSQKREEDIPVFGLLVFLTNPVLPLLALSLSKGDLPDFMGIIILLLPFVAGYLWGNRNPNVRARYASANLIILPFWGISVGANINLASAFVSFGSGAFLVLLFYLLAFLPLFLGDRKIRKTDGFIPTSTAEVAAMALVVPALAAQSNPALLPYVESAQNQLATAFLLTSALTPFLVKKLFPRRDALPEKAI